MNKGDDILSGFTSGFQELVNKLTEAEKLVPIAIDYALEDTGEKVAKTASKNSPVDTQTLQQSWDVNPDTKQTGENSTNNTHSIEVWSDPEIIAMNPKHPNGEYYPPLIENGFTKPNGKFYSGRHMLKNAMTPAKDDLEINLMKQLGDVFKR